jgi:SAM-dependent MidA family methyltransferase
MMIETSLASTSLESRLRERIRREGPISFCDWMSAALYDPADGYYCQAGRPKWGRQGDYRTSPERSLLFPATFARYFARLYDELGRPASWSIVEFGAGEGHFAAGVLQTLRDFFPHVFSATTYVIDELSTGSRAVAAERLLEFTDRVQFGLDASVVEPAIVFTNEFLDALPIHRITVGDGEIKEYYVTVNSAGKFDWQLCPLSEELRPRVEAYFAASGARPNEGQAVEVNLDIEDWFERIAGMIRRGYLVTVDYGAPAEILFSREGTLRGFSRHQFVDDLLASPGEHDLTATVNWDFVKSIGARLGLEVVDFQRQDQFLLAAGLLEQLELESTKCLDDVERLKLSASVREMILPQGMSTYFQVLVQKKVGDRQ